MNSWKCWSAGRVQGAVVLLGGALVCAGLSACGTEEEAQDPARQRLRTEVLTVRDALRSQPDSPILYYQLGQIYRKYGVADSARLALEHSIQLHPAFPQAQQQLAQVYFEAGDLKLSEAAWARTARLVPDNLESWNNLGYVRRQLGDLDGAEQAYTRALEVDGGFAETLNNLGQVYREQERWELAEDHFHKAMAADPTFRGAYVNLARLHQDRGDADAEASLLIEIRERFGRTSREGRYASVRLQALAADGAEEPAGAAEADGG